MHLVALETSSARGGVALVRDLEDRGAEVVEELRFAEGLVHGRECNVQVDVLLKRHGLRPPDVDAFAVSAGPGSYTGIRVGVTAAKTLAFALSRPLVAVSSLAVIAANAFPEAVFPEAVFPEAVFPEAVSSDRLPVAVVLDGKQGHLYRALFRAGADRTDADDVDDDHGGGLTRSLDDGMESLERLGSEGFPRIPSPAMLIGDGANLALSMLPAGLGYERGPEEWDWPRAGTLGVLAARDLKSGAALTDREAIHRLQPAYMRVSEAERRFRAATARKDS